MNRGVTQSDPAPEGTTSSVPSGRLALLFIVSLVTAAGNTAMQSVMPSIGTALKVEDFWISLAYTWSALLWMICAPFWARRSDRRRSVGDRFLWRLYLLVVAGGMDRYALH